MPQTPNRAPQPSRRGVSPVGIVLLVLLSIVLVFVLYKHATAAPAGTDKAPETGAPAETRSPVALTPAPAVETEPAEEPEPTPTEEPIPTLTPLPDFAPFATESTEPSRFLHQMAIQVDGETLADPGSFRLEEPIDFAYGDEYTDLQGVITFRGNNFRDAPSYGLAELREYKFGESWSVNTGTLTAPDGATWTGSGWVGQPLLIKWPRETKAVMNLYDWAKEDDDLVEVIYATMDGNVYFLDLNTGKATRDKLNLGFTFKGAGALDPRGYPILYLGSGYDSNKGRSRAFIISLIDFEILHTFGPEDAGAFSLRGNLSYFDGSPLVDAETDQLIYPGENGIIYIIKLNTNYDPTAGTLSIEPKTVKWHYNGLTNTGAQYWIGMEDSPVIWRGHMIVADNGGRLMCIDLNSLQPVWVQNILDDSNGSPVLSMEDGHPFIYISTSFHYGWRSWTTAPIPIFKIDAENGEIVWQTEYTCHTESGVSGGVQSTIALGKGALEGLIYVTVAKTENTSAGLLACINRKTGEVLWEHKGFYTWSSPVLVYNSDGTGVVVYCDYNNHMFMLDGMNGELLDTFNTQGGCEASPAVYENTVVIGTRQCKIWGVKMK